MIKNAGTVCLAAFFLMASVCLSCMPRMSLTQEEQTDTPRDLTIEMVFVKGGCFQMGDNFGDGKGNERPVHEVCLDDFFMGKYVVTQGQWKRIMGTNPSHF